MELLIQPLLRYLTVVNYTSKHMYINVCVCIHMYIYIFYIYFRLKFKIQSSVIESYQKTSKLNGVDQVNVTCMQHMMKI